MQLPSDSIDRLVLFSSCSVRFVFNVRKLLRIFRLETSSCCFLVVRFVLYINLAFEKIGAPHLADIYNIYKKRFFELWTVVRGRCFIGRLGFFH